MNTILDVFVWQTLQRDNIVRNTSILRVLHHGEGDIVRQHCTIPHSHNSIAAWASKDTCISSSENNISLLFIEHIITPPLLTYGLQEHFLRSLGFALVHK